MRYSFHPDARDEFEEGIKYYEEREYGLGYDFSIEVYLTVERIAANPKAWPTLEQNIRRCLVRRFPYGILYNADESTNEIYIVAVMHLRREPGYWKQRI